MTEEYHFLAMRDDDSSDHARAEPVPRCGCNGVEGPIHDRLPEGDWISIALQPGDCAFVVGEVEEFFRRGRQAAPLAFDFSP